MSNRSDDELSALLALYAVKGVGDARFSALLRAFGSAHAVLSAPPQDLTSVDGISPAIATSILEAKATDETSRVCERIANNDITALTVLDAEYPPHLAEIEDAPALLFVKGDIGLLELPGVAVVGRLRRRTYSTNGSSATVVSSTVNPDVGWLRRASVTRLIGVIGVTSLMRLEISNAIFGMM